MLIPVVEELKTLLRTSGLPLRYVAFRANCRRETLKRWLDGGTFFPRIDTMLRVANVLGQHIKLTSNVEKMVKFYPPPHLPPPVIRPSVEQWRH